MNKSGSSTEVGLGVPLQGGKSFQSTLEEAQCAVGQILTPLYQVVAPCFSNCHA